LNQNYFYILTLYDIAALRDLSEEIESEQLVHTDILTLYDIAALRDSREEVESEQLLLADVCRLPVRSGVTHIKRDPYQIKRDLHQIKRNLLIQTEYNGSCARYDT